jgi:hypothetical protein
MIMGEGDASPLMIVRYVYIVGDDLLLIPSAPPQGSSEVENFVAGLIETVLVLTESSVDVLPLSDTNSEANEEEPDSQTSLSTSAQVGVGLMMGGKTVAVRSSDE